MNNLEGGREMIGKYERAPLLRDIRAQLEILYGHSRPNIEKLRNVGGRWWTFDIDGQQWRKVEDLLNDK